jgi:hypothetical protein
MAAEKVTRPGARCTVAAMMRVALACAVIAIVAALLPAPGMYVGLGAGIAALGWGWASWADRQAQGSTRLIGAAAAALGTIALLLAGLRVGLTIAAIDRLERLLGG